MNKKRDKRRFSEEMEVKICSLYKEGLSSSQIANLLKIKESKIYYVLKLNEIQTRDASSPFYKKIL